MQRIIATVSMLRVLRKQQKGDNTMRKYISLSIGLFMVAMLFMAAYTRFGRLILTDDPEITGANAETISNATNGTWAFGTANITHTGNLTTTGNNTTTGTLDVTGNSTLSGTLAVTGTSALTGNLTASDKLGLPIYGAIFDSATAKVANYTLNATSDCVLSYFTNSGVTSATEITFILPTAAAGISYTIAGVVAGATVNVDASSGDVIYGIASSAGDKITAVGAAMISLVAVDATTWAVIRKDGTWSDTN